MSYDGLGEGTDDCRPCPRGFYFEDAATCIPCEDGYTTTFAGAHTHYECQHYSALYHDMNLDCGANGECKLLRKTLVGCVCDPGGSNYIKTFIDASLISSVPNAYQTLE